MGRRIDQVAEGLTILSKYDADGSGVSAQYSVLYAGGGDPDAVAPEDAARLRELGWHIDDTVGSWARFKVGDRVEFTVSGRRPDTYRGEVTRVMGAGYAVLCEDGVERAAWTEEMRATEPPTATRPTDPAPPADPLLCPRCSTPSHPVAMRTRGEVRSRVWQCGCPVRPDVVHAPEPLRATPREMAIGCLWTAIGHGVSADHPTEAGAIAAWRVALEQRQREDDERAVRPEHDDEVAQVDYAWRRGSLRDRIDPSASAGHLAPIVKAVESGQRVTVNITPRQWSTGVLDRVVRATMRRRLIEREDAALATLPTRTDDEVRQVAAACTEATHVETLVAVANECARRWPSPRWGSERPTFCVEASGAIGGTWAPSGDAWFPTAAAVIEVMRRIAGVA